MNGLYNVSNCNQYLPADDTLMFFNLLQLRACHKLTGKLRRQVILGSSSLDDPAQFITVLKVLKSLPF